MRRHRTGHARGLERASGHCERDRLSGEACVGGRWPAGVGLLVPERWGRATVLSLDLRPSAPLAQCCRCTSARHISTCLLSQAHRDGQAVCGGEQQRLQDQPAGRHRNAFGGHAAAPAARPAQAAHQGPEAQGPQGQRAEQCCAVSGLAWVLESAARVPPLATRASTCDAAGERYCF